MAESPLIIKSKEFALQIIKVCNYVKQTKKESVLTNQLIRSGTSVGANIREAFYGHGTAQIKQPLFNVLNDMMNPLVVFIGSFSWCKPKTSFAKVGEVFTFPLEIIFVVC